MACSLSPRGVSWYLVPVRFVVFWALVGLAACASNTEEVGEDEELGPDTSLTPGRGEVVPAVRYADTAEGNYARAEERFKDEDYLAAQRYYGYIRSKYPYSRFSVLADLRIADCQFGRKRYIEAVDSYQNFIRLHPTHEEVPYARFKIGRAYYEQIPGEWFLLPPAYEKDQAAIRDAERALQSYVDLHQGHENFKEAKKLLDDVRRRLMDHERYVADFYKREDRDRAYVGRLEIIRKDYADVGLDDALLLEIARAYARLEDEAQVKGAVDELVAKFPKSSLRPKAEKLLEKVADSRASKPLKASPSPSEDPSANPSPSEAPEDMSVEGEGKESPPEAETEPPSF